MVGSIIWKCPTWNKIRAAGNTSEPGPWRQARVCCGTLKPSAPSSVRRTIASVPSFQHIHSRVRRKGPEPLAVYTELNLKGAGIMSRSVDPAVFTGMPLIPTGNFWPSTNMYVPTVKRTTACELWYFDQLSIGLEIQKPAIRAHLFRGILGKTASGGKKKKKRHNERSVEGFQEDMSHKPECWAAAQQSGRTHAAAPWAFLYSCRRQNPVSRAMSRSPLPV